MKCALFSLKTQFENAGDALINRELIRLVAERTTTLVDLSRCPSDFARSLDLPRYAPAARIVSSWQLVRAALWRRLTGAETYYFLSPGGYVGECRGGAHVAMWLNSLLIVAMTAIGLRVCLVGVSFERLGPRQRRMLVFRSRFLFRIIARDEGSLKYAQSLGMRIDGLMSDLAFAASSYRENVSKTGLLAISFRSDQVPEQSDEARALVKRLDKELPVSVGFRFIAQVKRDAPLMRELSEACNSARRLECHSTWDVADRALDAYSDCEAVVSNRLHSLIFGMLGGCRPVPVLSSVNEKVARLFNALNYQTLAVNDAAAVVEAVRSKSPGAGEIRETCLAQARKLKEQFWTIIEGPR